MCDDTFCPEIESLVLSSCASHLHILHLQYSTHLCSAKSLLFVIEDTIHHFDKACEFLSNSAFYGIQSFILQPPNLIQVFNFDFCSCILGGIIFRRLNLRTETVSYLSLYPQHLLLCRLIGPQTFHVSSLFKPMTIALILLLLFPF